MLDTRHITEHFTVMSGNTVSGLTIKIRSSYLCLPFNLRSTDRKVLKPSASKPSSLKLLPRPTSASNRHKHHKQKTVSDSTMKIPFSDLLVKGVKLAAKGTGFVSLVAVVNYVPIVAYQHFGPWSPKELERGVKRGQYRPGS